VALFIGLMSGTSLDGVDGVLADFGATTRVLAHRHQPFTPPLRQELLALNRAGDNELHRAALAANALVDVYAGVVGLLLKAGAHIAADIAAVGAHGQTVRHRPGEFDATGYTLQLMNGALLAERSGIDVVCDFRNRDLAAGGQGAPLVPAFHAERFAEVGRDVAVLNLGGIANLTLLPATGAVIGFDCGPGNGLMDHWCQQHRGQPFDADGSWAASGRVDATLLATLLADAFFARPPPKSTGRDLFHAEWLSARLPSGMAPVDVMATLAELTVRGASDALARLAPGTRKLLVCGGGAFNGHLMRRLAASLPAAHVASTAVAGVPPDQVEALAFAWLAWAFKNKRAGNLTSVTGARGLRLLGALYPA
jgi:anhydro-N-acetylmuramic acid kinase